MRTVDVEGQVREIQGKSAIKALRKSGMIPCVIYGAGHNLHFAASESAVKDLIFTDEFRKAKISVGDRQIEAIVKDVQYHPVSDAILHIDFQELVIGKAVKVELPVRLVGSSEGVKVGGTMQQKLRKLQVKAKPSGMCSHLELDVTTMGLGSTLRVRNIAVNEDIEVITNGSIPVATIEIPRALRSAQTKAAAPGKKK